MSLARYAKRKDANQDEIVRALERVGAEVWVIDRPGDVMVWFRGRWYIAEIKQRLGRFTRLQKAERDKGLCQGILTWRTALEALEAIGAARMEQHPMVGVDYYGHIPEAQSKCSK